MDGNRLGKLDGVRVQCVACLPDGRTILAADTHKRVRAYVFDELQDSVPMYVTVYGNCFLSVSICVNYLLLLLLLLCAGIHAKGASERLLCQRDGLGWFERELVQR